ncbi:hypothetical protein MGAST_16985 [Mycobacterium gastri 'Wayne']|nr:hypothetical protein MGAST_16985 [Mycobacterium gastri 'Wayne']
MCIKPGMLHGALGFWKAVRDVFPDTKEQRCWWHKIGNVLAALPKSTHLGAKKALAEIYNAENKEHATKAAETFAAEYGAKWPKAAAKITDDLDMLLAFYDFPAEHWVHCALRTRLSRPLQLYGYGNASPKAPAPELPGWRWRSNSSRPLRRWRLVNAPHLVALVRAGAEFKNGKLAERPKESGGEAQAA